MFVRDVILGKLTEVLNVGCTIRYAVGPDAMKRKEEVC
jgi:hypothetical protein